MYEKILVVDDEPDVVSMLKDNLEMMDYKVLTAFNCNQAIIKLEDKPDLILLDINMPGMDGISFCKKIREFVACPIIFLTANGMEADRVKGLEAGGDDYIVKPFSVKELNARIGAHLRRESRRTLMEEYKFFNGFTLSFDRHKLFYNDEEIDLTKTEFDILSFMVINRNRTLSKDQIYEHLWGWDKFGDSSIITEHVRRIRGKLKECTPEEIIKTVWGVGYQVNI